MVFQSKVVEIKRGGRQGGVAGRGGHLIYIAAIRNAYLYSSILLVALSIYQGPFLIRSLYRSP